jgi:hypothetical protein
LQHIGRYQVEARLFFDDRRVLKSIAVLFSHIINYLVRANCHVSRTNPIRSARAAFSTKFSQISKTIDRCASDLDREIRTASEARPVSSSKAAVAEYAEQELFREGGHYLRDLNLRTGSNTATECRTAFQSIKAWDPRKEITGKTQNIATHQVVSERSRTEEDVA